RCLWLDDQSHRSGGVQIEFQTIAVDAPRIEPSSSKTALGRPIKAKQDGIRFERARSQRLMAGQNKQMKKLQERIAQLEKGTTPQTDGLEFEHKLVARLQREFPKDKIEHKGQGGDILHTVKFSGQAVGVIIYECKRCPRISSSHVQQAYVAKQTRRAHFAVLVTTGQRRGFSGLCLDRDVLIVSPLGTIPLASLLRDHLIEMQRNNIEMEKRAAIAQELLSFITSPEFKNPIEEIIRTSGQLQDILREEVKSHYRTWKKRSAHYQLVEWDAAHIQANLRSVIHGEKAKLHRAGK
ncbi:MAG: DUF2130 domain-containing protein, partial [Candidatus Sulfotelmatobacter sp.]